MTQPRKPAPMPVRRYIPPMTTLAGEPQAPSARLIANGTGIHENMPHDLVLPFLDEAVQVADWAASPSGYTVRLKLLGEHAVHPFRGLIRPGTAGHRILLRVTDADMPYQPDGAPHRILYDDQALVTWRGDDSIHGMTVAIRLDTVHGEHPFIDTTQSLRGSREGSPSFHAKAWVVDDQERLCRAKVDFSELSPVVQAARLCQHGEYMDWITGNARMLMRMCGAGQIAIPDGAAKAEVAAVLTRTFLGVSSRKMLEQDTREGFDARMKWQLLLSLYKAREVGSQRRYDQRFQAPPG